MQHVLLAAATPLEIEPFCAFLRQHYTPLGQNIFTRDKHSIHVLYTGVGAAATAFSLGKALALKHFDAAIQAGIAGTFDEHLPLGSLLQIDSEAFADLGASDKGNFLSVFDLGLADADAAPFSGGELNNKNPFRLGETILPSAKGITVNTASGEQTQIADLKNRFPHACTESMEGAAFHYACLIEGVPFLQVRAVSNYITPRDRSAWKIGLAVTALNNYLQDGFSSFPS